MRDGPRPVAAGIPHLASRIGQEDETDVAGQVDSPASGSSGEEFGLTRSQWYQHFLPRLEELGIIEHTRGLVRLKPDFSKVCVGWAKFWADWTNSEITLRFDLRDSGSDGRY